MLLSSQASRFGASLFSSMSVLFLSHAVQLYSFLFSSTSVLCTLFLFIALSAPLLRTTIDRNSRLFSSLLFPIEPQPLTGQGIEILNAIRTAAPLNALPCLAIPWRIFSLQFPVNSHLFFSSSRHFNTVLSHRNASHSSALPFPCLANQIYALSYHIQHYASHIITSLCHRYAMLCFSLLDLCVSVISSHLHHQTHLYISSALLLIAILLRHRSVLFPPIAQLFHSSLFQCSAIQLFTLPAQCVSAHVPLCSSQCSSCPFLFLSFLVSSFLFLLFSSHRSSFPFLFHTPHVRFFSCLIFSSSTLFPSALLIFLSTLTDSYLCFSFSNHVHSTQVLCRSSHC